jgi:tetratricopeptide (TPR) repeat protein
METMHDQAVKQDHQEAAQALFREGLSCWKMKKIDKALHFFQRAHEIYPGNLLVASYLGVSLARAGITDREIELCREASRKRSFNEDLLFNLGQAYLFAGNRVEARKTFLLGAKGCSNPKRFMNALLGMGVRRKPTIGFLPRHHFLNRWLGKLTYRPEAARIEDIEN